MERFVVVLAGSGSEQQSQPADRHAHGNREPRIGTFAFKE